MKWTFIEKKGYPTKEGIYAIKYIVHQGMTEKWGPWGIAIWNGEGFNVLSDNSFGKKIKGWALLWSDE